MLSVRIWEAFKYFDKSFSKYVERVLDFSKIQKGIKLHQHGLSLNTVAKLVGVSEWDLMKKVGETKERNTAELTSQKIKDRYNLARKILRGE